MRSAVLFAAMLIAAAVSVFRAADFRPDIIQADMYVVDSELMRLIRVNTDVIGTDTRYIARQLVRKLIEGNDSNRKIRRLIPDDKNCLSVKLDGTAAYVDIKKSAFGSRIDSRELERLLIYQITNTLTSVDGINTVNFSVDNRSVKKFAGFLDLRETYVFENPL